MNSEWLVRTTLPLKTPPGANHCNCSELRDVRRGTQNAFFPDGGVMSKHLFRNGAALLIVIALALTSAFAREDRHDHGRPAYRESHQHMQHAADHRRWERSRAHEHWRQQHRRWRAEHSRHDRRPDGWNHGQKTGWHGNNVPPANANSNGAHTWSGHRK